MDAAIIYQFQMKWNNYFHYMHEEYTHVNNQVIEGWKMLLCLWYWLIDCIQDSNYCKIPITLIYVLAISINEVDLES